MTAHIRGFSLQEGYPVFTRVDAAGNIKEISLDVMLQKHFHEFLAFKFVNDKPARMRPNSSRDLDPLVCSIVSGYLDSHDWMAAVRTLSSPTFISYFPGTNLIVRLVKGVWELADEKTATRLYMYLKRALEEQSLIRCLPEILNGLKVQGFPVGWPSLVQMTKVGSNQAFYVVDLLYSLFLQDLLDSYPNMKESAFAKFMFGGGGRRGSEADLGSFIMAPFVRPGNAATELQKLAHNFLELGYMCVLLDGTAAAEKYLADFYELSLVKNIDDLALTRFVCSTTESFADAHVSQMLLSRKFNFGPAPSFSVQPLENHRLLLKAALRPFKSKFNIHRPRDMLQYNVFLASIRPYFNCNMSSLAPPAGGKERIPWITIQAVKEIADMADAVVFKRDKSWNIYLTPYKTLCWTVFGEKQIILEDTTQDEEEGGEGWYIEVEAPLNERTRT